MPSIAYCALCLVQLKPDGVTRFYHYTYEGYGGNPYCKQASEFVHTYCDQLNDSPFYLKEEFQDILLNKQ